MKPKAGAAPLHWSAFLSPAGAGFVLICFFLPWGKFSCAGVHVSRSGAQLGGSFWSLFWAGMVVLVAGGVMVWRRSATRTAIVVLASSLYGLGFLIAKSISLSRGVSTPFGRIHPEDIGVKPHFGGAGTVVGFLIAAAGAYFAWSLSKAGARDAASRGGGAAESVLRKSAADGREVERDRHDATASRP